MQKVMMPAPTTTAEANCPHKFVLAERERELLELKGPCSTCRLHYAHSGPCDMRRERS